MSDQDIGVKRDPAPRPDWAMGVALACVVGMLFPSMRANRIDRATAAILATQAAAFRAADELRQSSDDLTRMARAYAATGDGATWSNSGRSWRFATAARLAPGTITCPIGIS